MPRPLIANRRDRILDAAEALILKQGFDQTSIQMIAEAVGIAKGAVYREFIGKNEIVDELLKRAMGRVNARYEELLGGVTAPLLSEGYRAGTQALLSEPLMVAALLDDEGILGTYIIAVKGDRYRQRYLSTVEWIKRLQGEGRLSSRVEPESLALALSSATLGLLTAHKTFGPFSAEELQSALSAMEHLVTLLEPEANNAISAS